MTLPKQSATFDGKALAQDYQGNNACISPSSLALLTDLTHLTRKILLQQKFGKKKYIWQKYVRNKKEVWNMCQMCQTSESYIAGSCCICGYGLPAAWQNLQKWKARVRCVKC